MDVQIERNTKTKSLVKTSLIVVGAIALGLLCYRWINPGIPTLERESLYIDFVQKGDLLREVRGVGTIVPQEVRFITSTVSGSSIKKINIRAGAEVKPDTVIVVLDNPELKQDAFEAESSYKAAEDEIIGLELQLEQTVIALKSNMAQMRGELEKARLDYEVNEVLISEGLIGEVIVKKSRMLKAQLETQLALEDERLKSLEKSNQSQLAIKRAELERAKTRYGLLASQVDELHVVAGITGVLQRLTVEEGQNIDSSEVIAEVADLTRLKAELRIQEMRSKDIEKGLKAIVDLGNGTVEGFVSRIDPAVEEGTVAVDVVFLSKLPRGTRTDLTVEGRILIEKKSDVIFVGKPAMITDYGQMNLFRIEKGSDIAVRTMVKFGNSSITNIEVLEGLASGDRVVLSDTTAWDHYDRVRIK